MSFLPLNSRFASFSRNQNDVLRFVGMLKISLQEEQGFLKGILFLNAEI